MSRVSFSYRHELLARRSLIRILRHLDWIGRIEEAADVMEARDKEGIPPKVSRTMRSL